MEVQLTVAETKAREVRDFWSVYRYFIPNGSIGYLPITLFYELRMTFDVNFKSHKIQHRSDHSAPTSRILKVKQFGYG